MVTISYHNSENMTVLTWYHGYQAVYVLRYNCRGQHTATSGYMQNKKMATGAAALIGLVSRIM